MQDKVNTKLANVEVSAKRAIKDSVFRDLFSNKKYLIQLYQCLHPEDVSSTEDDIEYVTLEDVLVNDLYNDLGFLVGNKMMIFVEAQSTWSENIIVRCFLYAGQTLQNYLRDTEQSVYSSKKVSIPEIEFYVVYTGPKKNVKSEISLSEEFFENDETDLEIKVRVITEGKAGDIINQYIVFTKVINDQVVIYGRTETAVKEAIRICKDLDVLKEYLSSREKEVVGIMTTLFSQEKVIDEYVASEKRETRNERNIQVFINMVERGYPIEDARIISEITPEQEKEAFQLMKK